MAEKKKHLHELLEDDQEPFHLNHYISNLRSQMGYSDLRLKKRKSNNNDAAFLHGFFSCETSSFLATHKSPDPRKSPLFDLQSPANKKIRDCRVFLQIPTRTAAILLEAAARIQKQQSEKAKTNNKTRTSGNGFGMFGSILKRFTNRKPKPRLDNDDGNAERGSEPTSSSCRRERFLEMSARAFPGDESPFHFVLHTTTPSSSGHQTPHFTSTATSPTRRSTEDEDSDEIESLEKVRGKEEDKDKEEDDKEQCSPVSVLDPLEEEEEDEDHNQHEPDHLDLLTCSFEVVQRAKRRLLKKLRRFEKLAGLDPVELEGKMSEEEEEYEESEEDDTTRVSESDEEYEDMNDVLLRESGCAKEERKKKNDERQKKWRMMNTWRLGFEMEEGVDTMVWRDMREEAGEWTRYGGEVEEAVSDLELSIFSFLIDEFSHELVAP